MKVHILTPPHVIPIWKQNTTDAFCQRALNLAYALQDHVEVHVYGNEGGDQVGIYHSTLSQEEFEVGYHREDTDLFDTNGEKDMCQLWNYRANLLLQEHVSDEDFICCSFGRNHFGAVAGNPKWSRSQEIPGFVIESGIGYNPPGTFAPYRIYESYMWMHYHLGAFQLSSEPKWTCIYNMFDPKDFPEVSNPEDYVLFIGRLNEGKGVSLAIEAARQAGVRIILAGPGDATPYVASHVEYVGVVDPLKRGELMAKAIATMVPSQYTEPLGYVHLESMMAGTPPITTDHGAFVETITQGSNGFRCRSMNEFVEAIREARKFSIDNRLKIQLDTEVKYSLEKFRDSHLRYFSWIRSESNNS